MSLRIPEVSKEQIAEARAINYRRTSELRVETLGQARQFVDQVGFCHFWPIKDVEMPSLFHAVAGQVRSVPKEHNDPDLGKCWGWKDQSLGKHWWYYGKLLRKRATFVSLDCLPTFYACSENYGDIHDYLEEYRDGTLSAEAKVIYEALLEQGPLDTVRLRRETQMSAESSKSRFDRALVELQTGLKVLPIGVAETGAWNYSFVYELLQRHFPDLVERARHISRSGAQQKLVQTYLDNVVSVERKVIGQVFHVMRWTSSELDEAVEKLLQDRQIVEITLKETSNKQLATNHLLR
jgi:hypothetical protein